MTHHDKSTDNSAAIREKVDEVVDKVLENLGQKDESPELAEGAETNTNVTTGQELETKNLSEDSITAETEKEFIKRSLREAIKCSFCANSMTQSVNMNWQPPEEGKSIAENAVARNLGPEGEKAIQPVLCDDCQRLKDSGVPLRCNTVPIDDGNGNISNPGISEF